MSGSRAKKNEEIKRYRINRDNITPLEFIPVDDYHPDEYCTLKHDITLMIEQMGAMKDQIDKLTDERDHGAALLKERSGYYYHRDVPHQTQIDYCMCQVCTDYRVDKYLSTLSKDTEEEWKKE